MLSVNLLSSLLLLRFINTSHAVGTSLGRARSAEKRYYEHDVNLDESEHDVQFSTFVSRPDLLAPRWDVEVYDASRLAPGHWFTSPYPTVVQQERGDAWTAPHIYDASGELIWSGAAMFGGFSTFDFRVFNILGKQMLSLVNFHDGNAWILDESYNVYKTIDLGDRSARLVNMHEFTTVENGTKALHMLRDHQYASLAESQSVGFDGACFVDFDGFRELDVATWDTSFEFTSRDHIRLNESYAEEGPIESRCASAWEFLHLNSVDKFPDGDYLVSGRRTFAIYKVSHIDGSIVWRVGGKDSDFDLDLQFSGQHSARVHAQNDTHTIVSFLDNAFYKPYIDATHANSRGVLLALRTDTEPMRTKTLMTFDHPDGGYATSRGNMEILPNGNAWLCWSSGAMHSEHGMDGTLIMKASFRAAIDSYRNFKSPWVGRPSQPPDVTAMSLVEEAGGARTRVWVSWNGDTETRRWRLWQADLSGKLLEMFAEMPREGFESMLEVDRPVPNLVVEAIDEAGNTIGRSDVVQTTMPEDQSELALMDEYDDTQQPIVRPSVAFFGALGFTVMAFALIWTILRKKGIPFLRPRAKEETGYELLAQEGLDVDGG